MKRAMIWALVVALLVAAAGFALARGMAPLERWIRADVVDSIPADVSIGELRLSFVPLRVTMTDVSIEHDGASLLEIDRLTVDLLLLDSIWEGRWVGDVAVERPRIQVAPGAAAWRHVIENREEGLQWRRVQLLSVDAQIATTESRISVKKGFVEVERSGLFEPRMHFSGSGALTATHEGRTVTFHRASLAGESSAGRVRIENGLLYGPAGLVRLDGELRDDALRLDGSWQTDGAALSSVVAELRGLIEGPSRARFQVTGTLSQPVARVWWTTPGMEIRGVPVAGTAEVTVREENWQLRARDVAFAGGSLTLEGDGEARPPWSFRLAARFEDHRLDSLARLFELPALDGRAEGEVHLSGLATGSPIDGRARVVLSHGDLSVDGEGRLERRDSTVRMTANLKDRFANALDLDVTLEDEQIDGRGQLEVLRLAALSGFIPGLEIEGRGSMAARLTGSFASVRARGEGEFREVTLDGVPVGEVSAVLDMQPDRIEVARLEIPAWRTTGRGRIALDDRNENDWRIEMGDLPLERVRSLADRWGWTLPPIGGRLEATVDATGSWQDPGIVGEFQISDIGVSHRRLGVAGGTLRRVPGQGWSLRGDIHHPIDGSAVVQGLLEPDGAFSVKARATGWRVAELAPDEAPWRDVDGRLQLDASLSGQWPAVNGEVELEVSSLAFRGQPLEPVRMTADLRGEAARLEGRMGERLRLDGEVSLRGRNAHRWNVSWTDLHLGSWIAPGASLVLRTSGSGELAGDVSEPLREGAFEVRELEIGGERVRLTNSETIALRVREGGLDVERASFTTGTDSISISGYVAHRGSRMQIEGATDLALLEALLPEVGSTRGIVVADLEVNHLPDGTWRPQGRVQVREGVFDLGYAVGVTDVVGEARFDGDGMDLEELRGRVGGGTIHLEGRVDQDAFEVSWRMSEAHLGVPLWLDYQLSGAGSFAGPWSEPVLSGDVTVVQAVYDRRFEWMELLPWVRGQIRPVPRPARVPVRLDLRVTADGGLYVENNLVRSELRGRLHVQGPVTDPVWSGELQVVEGTFLFRQREFTVTAGSVQFPKDRPRNPSLRFLGETVVITEEADYDIQLRVGGTVERPEVRLTSEDPTLSENDVLALVTFGRTVAQIQSQGTGVGIALEDVLALTAGRHGRRVERGVYRLLPVDRIEIEPAFSAATGTVEPRFSIGKEVMRDFRAFLRTGLGGERGQDVGLEYQLTRRLSLQGDWESRTKSAAGTFGGNVRLRFSFWRSPSLSMFRGLFAAGDGT